MGFSIFEDKTNASMIRKMALGWSPGPLSMPGLLFTPIAPLFSTVLASGKEAAHLVPKNAMLG